VPVEILQLTPLAKNGDDELHRKYSVQRWNEIPEKDKWLRDQGGSVRAIVTAGHLGVENDLLDRLPSLGIVAIAGVGYERVDCDRARSRGIRVTNTPNVLTDDVADFAIGLMIAAMRRIPQADRHVREGLWKASEMSLATKVSGRRYGIFGLGQIGRAVARRLEGFGGSIAYCATAPKQTPYRFCATLLELARDSDVLILTAAAGPTTRNAVDREGLGALGPEGVLVNVGRGALVDEGALIEVLAADRLASAALDVFADEPNVPQALRSLPNVVLAPHSGSATVEAREAMARLMLDNLDAFFEGKSPITPVV
jgi:hydroxypyruvate reductase